MGQAAPVLIPSTTVSSAFRFIALSLLAASDANGSVSFIERNVS